MATPSLSPLGTHQAPSARSPVTNDVRKAVRAWIVVGARRIAGGQRRGLVGRALGIRGAGCPPNARGPTMNEDRTAKLYAGQMGIVAVLVNVLIDKGVITESELRERFEQAHEAASRCSGGPGSRSCWRTC